jgi:hypothetical protein
VKAVKLTHGLEIQKAVERGFAKVIFKTGGRRRQVSTINPFEFDGASFLKGADERRELYLEILLA